MRSARSVTLRPGASWIQLLEAAYAPASDDAAWGEQLLRAGDSVFGSEDAYGLLVIRHGAHLGAFEPLLVLGRGMPLVSPAASLQWMSAAAVRSFFSPRSAVNTQLGAIARMPRGERALARSQLQATFDIVDSLGIVSHPAPGLTAVLFAGYQHEIALTKHERRLLAQIALHVEAGFRLRLRPESLQAVLAPDGTLVHREPGELSTDLLRHHVRRVERARTRRNRTRPEAIDAWTALLAGSLSLVERTEGSKRFYLMVENPPLVRPYRALTRGEADAITYAARGLSAKLIGYALGISQTAVSARLASAACKIGLASRTELVRLAALLTRDPRADLEDFALTMAERDVLALVAQGLSNEAIARLRNRSVRTIANQVASLLRKTGSPTRRALATQPVKGKGRQK